VGRAFDLLFIELAGGMKQKGNFTLWQTRGWGRFWDIGARAGQKRGGGGGEGWE
jgi:hypothetical protein